MNLGKPWRSGFDPCPCLSIEHWSHWQGSTPPTVDSSRRNGQRRVTDFNIQPQSPKFVAGSNLEESSTRFLHRLTYESTSIDAKGMNTSHICLSCRQRLGHIRKPKLVQWHPKANFISLSTPKPNANPKAKPQYPTSTHDSASDDIANLADDAFGYDAKRRAIPYIQPKKAPRQPVPGRSSPGDLLESLFEETIADTLPTLEPVYAPSSPQPSQQRSSRPTAVSYAALSPTASIAPYKNAETLKDMLKDPEKVVETWEFFLESFGRQPRATMFPEHATVPSYLYSLAAHLLAQLKSAKFNDRRSVTLPSVRYISRVYFKLGLLQPRDWIDMMKMLLEEVLEFSESSRDPSFAQSREYLINDLLGAWNVVCREVSAARDEGSEALLDWSHLPIVAAKDVDRLIQKFGIQGAFALLTPNFHKRHLQQLPVIAAATFKVLTDKAIEMDSISHASAFTKLLARFVSVADRQLFLPARNESYAPLTVLIYENFDALQVKASQMSEGTGIKPRKLFEPHKTIAGVEMGFSFINTRVQDAMHRRDLSQLDDLWGDVSQWPASDTTIPLQDRRGGYKHGTLSMDICNLFILGFMALKQANRAINVWNNMIAKGITPSLQTWDAMLNGCKIARNDKAIEDVWRKLVASGTKPDVVLWTTRISGLIQCKKYDLGIRALDEMGRVWLAAARAQYPKATLPQILTLGDVEGAVKPTIATCNGAISSFLRFDLMNQARQILAWAKKYNIQPDIYTYNTLLQYLIRNDKSAEAMTLLRSMSKANIEADVATFTTILDETFKFASINTNEEQKELVNAVFAEMEAAGVQPNLHTYGKLVSSLLQNCQGNLTTVNTVLERMNRQGLQPSRHIFTNLLNYYFSQPSQDLDLDVIQTLIDRADAVLGSSDYIFWDRVIEGYSKAGETTKATRYLRQVFDGKGKVGWDALRSLIVALAENQEWDIAKKVVIDVQGRMGRSVKEEERGVEGQHGFWFAVRELNLMPVGE